MLQDHLRELIAGLQRLADLDLAPRLDAAAAAVARALAARRAVLIAGNGGSAADALHIAAELVGRFRRERPAYNVIALTGNASILTAVGNDYGFDDVFARQVEAHGGRDGVLIAISTSGNSNNIIRAAATAHGIGMTVVGLTGEGGGLLREHADILLAAPSTVTAHIQEMHACLYHALCELVESTLVGARPGQERL
jgi:D-sedoheptulose 7-phosphate isomerase